jgi:hypothetical protein
MSRSDNVTNYLMKITQIRDQLAAVPEVIDAKLVNTALNGFSKSWEPFVTGICAREKLPYFENLWDGFSSRNRLKRSPKLTGTEVVMRTMPLSIRQEKEKERVPTRRIEVRSQPHSRGRIRT